MLEDHGTHPNKGQGMRQPPSKHTAGGFTLVELAIVLVVIGLVVGGVLVGQDLIAASELRAQIQDIQKINSAMNAFRLKYNCLAGDCPNATTYFTAGSQPDRVGNGNGDGKIQGYASDTAPINGDGGWLAWGTGEYHRVFDHLAAAGMYEFPAYDEGDPTNVNKPGIGYPLLKVNSKGTPGYAVTLASAQGGVAIGYEPTIYYIKAGNKIKLGACRNSTQYWSFLFDCGLNPSEAQSLDEKIDDGKPHTGQVVMNGRTHISSIPGNGGITSVSGCTNSNNTYNNSNPVSRGCGVDIQGGF